MNKTSNKLLKIIIVLILIPSLVLGTWATFRLFIKDDGSIDNITEPIIPSKPDINSDIFWSSIYYDDIYDLEFIRIFVEEFNKSFNQNGSALFDLYINNDVYVVSIWYDEHQYLYIYNLIDNLV